jgi:phospholipid-binding lipoprotein MlaA
MLLVASIMCGCATTAARDPRDPWEGFNRGVTSFNNAADAAVIKPVAKVYMKVVPSPVRTGVNNFFGNVGDIGVMFNNLLQGKINNAASDFGRLSMNTTFGVFGLIDVASQLGIPKHDEDFGQTLGRWGIGSGAYLVLPLLGPSTLRDGIATIPSAYLNPITYVNDNTTRWSLIGLGTVNTRANLLKATNILEEAALDKYIFTRDAFLQRRLQRVYDGNVPEKVRNDRLPDYDDPEPDPPANAPPSNEPPDQPKR